MVATATMTATTFVTATAGTTVMVGTMVSVIPQYLVQIAEFRGAITKATETVAQLIAKDILLTVGKNPALTKQSCAAQGLGPVKGLFGALNKRCLK